MSWVAILVLIVCIWLAFKVVGVLFKVVLWAVVLVGLYWLCAPFLGMPRPF
jgi:hypothetical protein